MSVGRSESIRKNNTIQNEALNGKEDVPLKHGVEEAATRMKVKEADMVVTLLISAAWKLMMVKFCEFEVRLIYVANSRTAKSM